MTMTFKQYNDLIQERIKSFSSGNNSKHVLEVQMDKNEFWELYLDSFPEGTNEIFRERREFDCSCCRYFIKTYGGLVTVNKNSEGEYVVETIWDLEVNVEPYKTVTKTLRDYVLSQPIGRAFFTSEREMGTEFSRELMEDGNIHTWTHFYAKTPEQCIVSEVNPIVGQFATERQMFMRLLHEVDLESVETVIDLIEQGTLYRGDQWLRNLQRLIPIYKEFQSLPESQHNLFSWEIFNRTEPIERKIRNTSIGTLLVNLSEGMGLEQAIKAYENVVAPENYKRPKPIFTKKMLEEAQEKVNELGYLESLKRRFANKDDININNVLYSNKDQVKKELDIFEELSQEIAVDMKKTKRQATVISLDKFINQLTTANNVEILFENRLKNNLVSLIAPDVSDSKNMFKWGNNFSWAYTGNITDSSMRENVKLAGGSVDGVVRFSIQWNDIEPDPNDLDAHCILPNGTRIYYGNKYCRKHGVNLDVDIINPTGKVAVENITFESMDKLQNGEYKFLVNNYSNRGGTSGFRAEVEINGEIHEFSYGKELRDMETVEVARMQVQNGEVTLKPSLPSSTSSNEHWGINTQQFIPVSTIMYSPNYWDNQAVGNKHVFFMLQNCINDELPSGFYNEYLDESLRPYRKVFEALSSKSRVTDSENQLSGLGFATTRKPNFFVRLDGKILQVEV